MSQMTLLDLGDFSDPRLLELGELQQQLSKTNLTLERLDRRRAGFLNHHEQAYVDTHHRRALKRQAKLSKQIAELTAAIEAQTPQAPSLEEV